MHPQRVIFFENEQEAVVTLNGERYRAIFQYVFDYLGFNPMNGNFDFVF